MKKSTAQATGDRGEGEARRGGIVGEVADETEQQFGGNERQTGHFVFFS